MANQILELHFPGHLSHIPETQNEAYKKNVLPKNVWKDNTHRRRIIK